MAKLEEETNFQSETKPESKSTPNRGWKPQRRKETNRWVSPTEGMMWSEVFGPPRSKKPFIRK